ncbi:MAG: hypothetical protein HY527_21590 [Betaproteobacteria bacterium]|nr:hypothetical protein [Betaproteobacteria bacterium]
MSTSFAPLARTVAEGLGHFSLPILVVPHPVGEREPAAVRRKGENIAAECARVLTESPAQLEREFREKQYPLPQAVMPR